jgi:sugar-specific transcriptional regulator TrmB
MDITQLSKIGLTPGEIKVYLALVRYGSQSKSPLARKADISSSKVYEIIGKLIKKGLASSFLKNNVTYYNASNPIFLKKYIEEKEKELQEEKEIVNKLIPGLNKIKESSEEKISFELQEGWEGTQNAIMEGIENAPENSTVYGIGIQFPRTEFINRFHQERLKKNIRLKIILAEPADKKQNYKNADIKFMPEISEVGMGIYPDRVLIQALDNPPLNLTMKHPRIVGSFKKIYESLWKIAKK